MGIFAAEFTKNPSKKQMIMKKSALLLLLCCMATMTIQAQRVYQKLGRGVVAVTRNEGQDVVITWRKLTADPDSAVYNLYSRKAGTTEYTKVNAEPYTKTNVSIKGSAFGGYNTELAVTAVDPKTGAETEKGTPFLFKKMPYPNTWLYIPLDTKVIPDNQTAYATKYAWPADMDGDGEIDAVVVDRLGGGNYDDAEDSEEEGNETTSTNHKIQCYNIDGTLMWTVEMGPNVAICAGQNDMVTVYDIDCDGKCDVLIKSSDGTRFWDKENNTFGKYVFGKDNGDVDGDGIIDYANTAVTRNPPFYISVIDGLTGAEKVSAELKYEEVYDKTDRYTRDNKKDYWSTKGYYQMGGHFAICHDGVHPYLAMKCLDRRTDDGHHDYVFAFGYDWQNGKPTNFHHFYTWSRNDKTPWPAEFHGNRVCDVDGDGLDEIIPGAFAVNPWKNMVCSPGVGHGDRFTVTDIDPERPGLEHFVIQQSSLLGQLLYDAATGEHIKEWYLPSVFDVGRGQCQDVLPDRLGCEMWSFVSDYIYDAKGRQTDTKRTYPVEPVWWDGDLLREGMAQRGGSGRSSNMYIEKIPSGSRITEFFRDANWKVHGNTGTRCAFWGDITGDWREENIQMEQGAETSTAIVGYSTHYPTDYTITCLMEDPHYRLDETCRGYYQSPNTSFYLGTDMFQEPLFDCVVADLRYKDGWSFTTFDQTATAEYADGKSLIFDISGKNSKAITIDSKISPSTVYLMNPKGHDYTFNGSGTLTGNTVLRKGMQGKATFNMNLQNTGKTVIHEGTLEVNGSIESPVYLMSRGTLAGNATVNGLIWFEGSHNYAGCRLMPGNASDRFGTITINNNVTLPGKVYIELDMETATNKTDKVVVNGDLTMQGENYFRIVCNETTLTPGTYTLAECNGTMTATTDNMKVVNLDGVPYWLQIDGNKIQLVIDSQRQAAEDVLWAGNESASWDYLTKNFTVNNENSYFVTGDKVVFDDTAEEFTVTLDGKVVTTGVEFRNDTKTYTLKGDGGLSGNGDLVKNGKGEVRMELENSDYTGRTIINSGRLTVTMVSDAGKPSSMGAAVSDEGYLQINGAELNMDGDNVATDRIVTITDTATITVKSGSALTLNNKLKGSGVLVKDGAGQLNLKFAGTNDFSGVVIRKGILKQANWQGTIGKSGAMITFMGGQLNIADNSSMSTTPRISNPMTVAEGSEGAIRGAFRCNINGPLTGKGTMKYISGGGRCYFNTDMSNFEGTLIGEGEELLLETAVSDMKKARLKPTGSITVYPSANELNLGSLIGDEKTTRMGGKVVNVGYMEEDHSYAGQLAGTTVNKVGTAQWELTGTGSTAGIVVKEGTLKIRNFTDVTTSSSLTVQNGARLIGRGTTQSVLLQKGATICPGIDANSTGELATKGNFIGYGGSTLLFKVDQKGNDLLTVGGTMRLNGDTIRIQPMDGRTFSEGESLKIFEGNVNASSKWVIDGGGYEWDDSQLATTGQLICTGLSTGVDGIITDEPDGTHYFDAQGMEVLPSKMKRHQVYIERTVSNGRIRTLKVRN